MTRRLKAAISHARQGRCNESPSKTSNKKSKNHKNTPINEHGEIKSSKGSPQLPIAVKPSNRNKADRTCFTKSLDSSLSACSELGERHQCSGQFSRPSTSYMHQHSVTFEDNSNSSNTSKYSPMSCQNTIARLMQDTKNCSSCTWTPIGFSVERQHIMCARFKANQPTKSPRLLVLGGLHAREWHAQLVVQNIIRHLAVNFDGKVDIAIVPLLNPDGIDQSLQRRYWRTNSRKVDLNRNFGHGWGLVNGGEGCMRQIGPNRGWKGQSFCGNTAFSEQESRAVKNLLNSAHFDLVVDVHSYGNYVFWPWSHTENSISNTGFRRLLEDLGNSVAADMNFVGMKASTKQKCSGTLIDWAAHMGFPTLLVEIGHVSRLFGVDVSEATSASTKLIESLTKHVVKAKEFLDQTGGKRVHRAAYSESSVPKLVETGHRPSTAAAVSTGRSTASGMQGKSRLKGQVAAHMPHALKSRQFAVVLGSKSTVAVQSS